MNTVNSPVVIAGHKVKNRICMPPLFCINYSGNSEGFASDKNISHYKKRAEAGTGLIVVEATCVRQNARLHFTQLGIWSDNHIEGLAGIANTCHEYGATVTIQLHHGGFNTHPECGESVSPSRWKGKYSTARALSLDEIETIQSDFIFAAIRAQKAGFDGVQLHACHRYLLNAFSSSIVNRRTDEYGGNSENRTRLTCDIIRSIRNTCGNDFIIDVRMAGNDPSIETGIENANYYIDAGADMLGVSFGTGDLADIEKPEEFPLHKISWLGANIKKHFPQTPVSAGYWVKTTDDARILSSYTDFVSVGRAMLVDENWTKNVLEGRLPDRPCISCKRCFWFSDPEKCPARNTRKSF